MRCHLVFVAGEAANTMRMVLVVVVTMVMLGGCHARC